MVHFAEEEVEDGLDKVGVVEGVVERIAGEMAWREEECLEMFV